MAIVSESESKVEDQLDLSDGANHTPRTCKELLHELLPKLLQNNGGGEQKQILFGAKIRIPLKMRRQPYCWREFDNPGNVSAFYGPQDG